ncbi:hypothetical protein [Streptomyces sp. NRRL F-2580]|uniref:hypothetical protein n=1 Tax=Streptomyces sp. NRRL F-2580 TaxID=1463841 RepID=UPI0004CA1DED|nr:hypothetical protein [Streptomyces sp. NRRL F-2580]
MSRPRRSARAAALTVWVGLAVAVAVLAVLLPAASAPAPAPAGPAAALKAASGPAVAVASGFLAAPDDGGPACAPGSHDHGGLPAAPARAGGEHAHLPPARPVPEGARPYVPMPVRVLVRGPDRPAPGPVELSVMRV